MSFNQLQFCCSIFHRLRFGSLKYFAGYHIWTIILVNTLYLSLSYELLVFAKQFQRKSLQWVSESLNKIWVWPELFKLSWSNIWCSKWVISVLFLRKKAASVWDGSSWTACVWVFEPIPQSVCSWCKRSEAFLQIWVTNILLIYGFLLIYGGFLMGFRDIFTKVKANHDCS